MHRRHFGKALVGGIAGAGMAATAPIQPSRAQGGAPARDMAYRVFPDLPVRRNDKIRSGGDYHTLAGPTITSPESINYFRRFNVRYMTARAHASATPQEMSQWPHYGGFLDADGPWDGDELNRMQDKCHSADMVLEGLRMDSAYIIMQPGPHRDQYLDIIRENIRKAARAGVQLVSYHWTMIPIRRNFTVPGRGGSTYIGFKLEQNYRALPPTEAAGRVSLEDYWSRIDYFLKAVVPVAREFKVRLAVHPYDPGGMPLGYQGVDNWDSGDYIAALKKYELLYDDPYNGFCFETGVNAESLPDPNAQLELLRYLSERGKIAQIHFRNVRGHLDNFIEVYEDEGDVNMLDIVRVLRDTGWEGTLLPDHNPNYDAAHPDVPKKLENFAFSYGYIESLLRAAREEAIKATRGTST